MGWAPVALGAAAVTALLWLAGALVPWHPRFWTSLDLRWYHMPVYEAFYASVRAGAPTLWNPYQLCGMPWLGTIQGGFFYPPHVLYVLLPTPWALAISTVGHLAVAAATMAALARAAGVSGAAALLGGAVFVAAGPLREWQLWPAMLEASAWLPLGALGVQCLTADVRHSRGMLLLAIASGMSWLAGYPQMTLFSGYAWASLLLVRLLAGRPCPADATRTVAAFLLALGTGTVLGAVTLVPAFEMAQQSVRRTSTLPITLMYPFGVPPPGRLLRGWLENGSWTLLLAILALAPIALLSRARSIARWAIVLGVLATAVSLGPTTPAFRLYLELPLLAWFRIPHRLLLLTQLALAVLTALGLDVIARRVGRRSAAVLVTLVLAGITVEGWRKPAPVPPLPYDTDARPWSDAHRDAYAALARSLDGARAFPFAPDALLAPVPAKLPTLAGLRSIEDYEPLTLRRQAEFFTYFRLGALEDPDARAPFNGRLAALAPAADGTPPAARRRLLDLAAVRVVLAPTAARERPDMAAFARDAGLVPRPPLVPGLERLDNPHALPRAFVTYRARPAPPPDALLPELARETFDPLAASFVEGDAGLPEPASTRHGHPAEIVRDDPHVVEVRATLAAPGLVVLADTFYPGWTATVDGAAAPILATNHLFRGVPVPAGTHAVRFAYRPRALWLGAAASLAAALGLALAWRRLGRGAAAA